MYLYNAVNSNMQLQGTAEEWWWMGEGGYALHTYHVCRVSTIPKRGLLYSVI